MRDRWLILAGLAIVLLVLTWPTWRAVASGRPVAAPVLARPTGATRCVAPVSEMRASHMTLLATWRDRVVRDGVRSYTDQDGQVVTMSLTGTCLRCHDDKSKFCDRCHDYVGAKPTCWDCHVSRPGGGAGLSASASGFGGTRSAGGSHGSLR